MVAEVATQDRVLSRAAAEGAQAPDQARGLRSLRPGEGMRLVEHQEVEPCARKQFCVTLARQ